MYMLFISKKYFIRNFIKIYQLPKIGCHGNNCLLRNRKRGPYIIYEKSLPFGEKVVKIGPVDL